MQVLFAAVALFASLAFQSSAAADPVFEACGDIETPNGDTLRTPTPSTCVTLPSRKEVGVLRAERVTSSARRSAREIQP